MSRPPARDVQLALRPEPFSFSRRVRLSGEVLALYAQARWLLVRGDLTSTVATLRGSVEDAGDDEASRVFGRRVGAALGRALDPLPFDSRCLMSSLVLTGLMARRGIRCTVVIGVRPAPSFKAHAWVEHRGSALLPSLEPDYQRLVEI